MRNLIAMLLIVLSMSAGAKGDHAPGWMGMGYVWSKDAAGHTVLHVQRIASAGPADAAGMKPGDTITTIDGRRVDFGDELDLLLYIGDRKAGDRIAFGIVREGRAQKIRVKLRAMPETSRQAWMQNLEVAKRQRLATQSRRR
ncbi:MAG: PDZ domain-containing protein [Thermoanaerobaculia bacterium]